jgi:hypothetical protein
METSSDPTSVPDVHADIHAIDSIDFEREFGAFDLASLFPGFDFIHDHFHGFYNIVKNGLFGSPPIASTFVPPDLQQKIMYKTRNHTRSNQISSFYFLTDTAYKLMCQVIFQAFYAIHAVDEPLLAVMSHQFSLVFLLCCIYYGVEHYMTSFPKNVESIPKVALKLSFAKGLHKLAHILATNTKPLIRDSVHSFTVSSGANLLEVKYRTRDPIEDHRGPIFDDCRKYTLSVEMTVHTFEMLPVVERGGRGAYVNERLKGMEDLASKLTLPGRSDPPGDSWLNQERVNQFSGSTGSPPMSS